MLVKPCLTFVFSSLLLLSANNMYCQLSEKELSNEKVSSAGNPVFKGWYADPEGAILKGNYWIYPTYSDFYEKQVFMDAFSSPDLVHWAKHSRIIDTASIK